jgi:hypothetical protein
MSDRQQILNDREFWSRLEYAASHRLEHSHDIELRRFWIDGFIPEIASNTKYGVDIQGVVWVGMGARIQQEYRFVASLPQKLLHRKSPTFDIQEIALDNEEQFVHLVIASRMPDTERCAGSNGSPVASPDSSDFAKGPPSAR